MNMSAPTLGRLGGRFLCQQRYRHVHDERNDSKGRDDTTYKEAEMGESDMIMQTSGLSKLHPRRRADGLSSHTGDLCFVYSL